MPGFHPWPTSGLIIPMGTGYIPIMDGPGFQITRGDGLLSIMEDG